MTSSGPKTRYMYKRENKFVAFSAWSLCGYESELHGRRLNVLVCIAKDRTLTLYKAPLKLLAMMFFAYRAIAMSFFNCNTY